MWFQFMATLSFPFIFFISRLSWIQACFCILEHLQSYGTLLCSFDVSVDPRTRACSVILGLWLCFLPLLQRGTASINQKSEEKTSTWHHRVFRWIERKILLVCQIRKLTFKESHCQQGLIHTPFKEHTSDSAAQWPPAAANFRTSPTQLHEC